MHFVGLSKKGKPEDSFTGVHPDILNHYCSTTHPNTTTPLGRTGAGHPPDEDSESEWEDDGDSNTLSFSSSSTESDSSFACLREAITNNLHTNIKHKPVKVPCFQNPFSDLDDTAKLAFDQAFVALDQGGHIPSGFGLLKEEWESGEYPTHEELPVGKRGKSLVIELPETLWYPRAVQWGRALYLLNYVLYASDE